MSQIKYKIYYKSNVVCRIHIGHHLAIPYLHNGIETGSK